MPDPMLSNNYQNISLNLEGSAKRVAKKIISMAASKIRGAADSPSMSVSVDRSWQRKGFTSFNEIITAISINSGKVLDTAILSKSCKGYTKCRR